MEIKISSLKNWKCIAFRKFNLIIYMHSFIIYYYILLLLFFVFLCLIFLSINIFEIEIIYRITPIYKYYLNLIPSLLK